MARAERIEIGPLVAGDARAWDAFVARFTAVVYSAVGKTLRTHAGAADEWVIEELVQDVFTRLVKYDCRLLASYDPAKSSLVTWLTIVARSTAIDFLRRRRLQTVPLEDQLDDVPAPEPAASAPQSLALPPDLLSPRQELVLRMMFEKDMDVPQIAHVLNVNEQTVRSTKHKGIDKLRRYFQDQSGDT